MNRLAAIALSFMAACAPLPQDPPPSRAAGFAQALPPMRVFTSNFAAPATRTNTEIVQDFLDLSFRMESGRSVAQMTRFEGPVTVRLTGASNPTMLSDLEDLLARLRNEAKIDIRLVPANQAASITVEALPRAILQAAVPKAACFVVPRLTSWSEFKIARRTPQVDWTTLTRRDRAAIFVPSDVAPQEIRDCLHEELAQALGPLNDLYRLPDSVFNDDNIHAVLTQFDMLILRTTYAPELHNGMSRGEAATRVPMILARLNPAGERAANAPLNGTSRDWIDAMETALTNGRSASSRRAAAQQAIALGQAFGWTDVRAGFAQYAYGRLEVGNNPNAALASFNAADATYSQSSVTQIHRAHIAVQQSAFALAAGDADRTIALSDSWSDVAARHKNAALLATLMMFKAAALEMRGDTAQADALRLDSLGWARYGFGSDQNVAARLNEIAALRPY
ncbi:DUF2927 domain-containing protein [Yoonia sp. MH D7]